MNKIYKLVWSSVKSMYVVASEFSKAHSKTNKNLRVSLVVLMILGALPGINYAHTVHNSKEVEKIYLSEKDVEIKENNIDLYKRVLFYDVRNNASSDKLDNILKYVKINDKNKTIEIGEEVTASGGGSIVIGGSSAAGSQGKVSDAIVIGNNSFGNSDKSIAIGNAAVSQLGNRGIAIGNMVYSNATDSIAIGYQTNAEADNSIAFGTLSSISNKDSKNSVAIGHGAYVEGNNSISIGSRSGIGSTHSIAIGNNSYVATNGSVAIGSYSKVERDEDNVISFGSSLDMWSDEDIVFVKKEFGLDSNFGMDDKNLEFKRRLIHVADGINNSDAVTVGQLKDYVNGEISDKNESKAVSGKKIKEYIDEKLKNVKSNGNIDSKKDELTKIVNENKTSIKTIQDDLKNKADKNANNLTSEDITKWQEKLGNGENKKGDKGLITGNTLNKALEGIKAGTVSLDGEISESNTTKGVTGNKIYKAIKELEDKNINRVEEVNDKVKSSGAMAAALSALRPLMNEYNPNNKIEFSVGYGNYNGVNAIAMGAYYRPNENAIFSLGSAFGNGDNMLNFGISWKLGRGSSIVIPSKFTIVKEVADAKKSLKECESAISLESITRQREDDKINARMDKLEEQLKELQRRIEYLECK